MEKQKTCAERIEDSFASVLEDLDLFDENNWAGPNELNSEDFNPEDWEKIEDLGDFNDYGLCFDYVEPDTFDDQPAGYYRFQISWGGPSSEFRFHGDGDITYHFMDWYDGAEKSCNTRPVIRRMAAYFQECELMPLFEDLVRF